ncbi:creatininase family protein [Verrucomicrobiota bacterium]
MDYYWIRNTEKTVAALRRATRGVAVLPLGSIESHGPHLPLGADPLCIEHIMARVLAKVKVAVLPTFIYSFVASARMHPGAIHIPSALVMDLAEHICDEVARNGFNKIVLIHGHGGNPFLGSSFTRRVLEKEKPYAVYSIPVLPGRREEMFAQCETTDIGHACELETSLCLAACPELVNMKALGRKTFASRPGPDVGCAVTPADWIARHPEMAVGYPQKADADKGDRILQIWADVIADCLRRIKKDTVCLSAMKRYTARVHSVAAARRDAG